MNSVFKWKPRSKSLGRINRKELSGEDLLPAVATVVVCENDAALAAARQAPTCIAAFADFWLRESQIFRPKLIRKLTCLSIIHTLVKIVLISPRIRSLQAG